MIHYPCYEEIKPPCPLKILSKVLDQTPVFLDSASNTHLGRFSFLAFSPFQTLVCKQGAVTLNNDTFHADPFTLLEQELKKFSLQFHEGLPPFQGGVAGLLGYELSRHLEFFEFKQQDDLHFPEMILGFYDIVIAWDHLEQRAFVFSSGYPLQEETKRLKRAQERLSQVLEMIASCEPLPSYANVSVSPEMISSTFTQANYMNAVLKVKDYIREGDIFEANISQRFSTTLPDELSAFDLYRRLRQQNCAPFAAYLQYQDFAIASASPERFLQLRKGHVQARPIKGTCPRHQEAEKDKWLAQNLLNSEKDKAENVMIVDLMRNDLSRVCLPHTVTVPILCGLESFATVHHLVSVVEGKLQSDCQVVDLLKATFPGGSITGAPKIRAMEIIAEIEPTLRGPYCGSMGYIGFNGDMDLSIIIRTFALNQQFATFQVGGAITLDSDPQQEYEETLIKAKALFKTLTT